MNPPPGIDPTTHHTVSGHSIKEVNISPYTLLLQKAF